MHRKDVRLMNDFAKEELIDLSLMLSELADISRDNLIYIKILKISLCIRSRTFLILY